MKLYFWSLLLFFNFQQNGPIDKNVSIVNEINSFYMSGQNLISTDSKESLHRLNKGLILSKDLNSPPLIALGNLYLSE